MHQIPSELRSQTCSGESSTRMGDLLGSPRVAPLVSLFSIIFLPLLLLLFFYYFSRRWGEGSFRGACGCYLADLCEHIFGLKILRFDLLAGAFTSVLYTKTVFKEFSAHPIAFHRCIVRFILLGGTWTCLSTGSHHYAGQFYQTSEVHKFFA